MKTIIASLLLVTWLANPAAAQSKKMHAKSMGSCPAASCTDHSYDQAYTAPQTNWKDEDQVVSKKNCPAATCTDHSYDRAYSAQPATGRMARTTARRPLTNTRMSMQEEAMMVMRNNQNSYSMNEYTYYGRGTTGVIRPSAYEGDDAPTYDGFQKNAYRNMRASNDSERLPSNNGK